MSWKAPKPRELRKPRLHLPEKTGGAHQRKKGGPYRRSKEKESLRQSHD